MTGLDCPAPGSGRRLSALLAGCIAQVVAAALASAVFVAPAQAKTRAVAATYVGKHGCEGGAFADVGRGDCWTCPPGYNRTILPVTADNACERPAREEFKGASGPRDGRGLIGTDCDGGWFFDFGLRKCYSCEGWARSAWDVRGDRACSRVVPLETRKATFVKKQGCPDGSFLDVGRGECWSCPAGHRRTIFPVTADNACEGEDLAKAETDRIEHIQIYGLCIQENSPGARVTTERCDPKSPYQLWFHAYARSRNDKNPLYKDKVVRQLRSVRHPDHCLTSRGIGETLTVLPCEPNDDRQTWWDHRKLTPGVLGVLNLAKPIEQPGLGCVAVWQRRREPTSDVVLGACDPVTDNMRFAPGNLTGAEPPSNAELLKVAETTDVSGPSPAWKNYVHCRNEGTDGCVFAMEGLVTPGALKDFSFLEHFTSLHYGRMTGKGWSSGGEPLDLGDRYSLDRCSQAHDVHFWDDEPGSIGNDLSMLGCMARVTPTSADEAYALDNSFKGIMASAAQTLGMSDWEKHLADPDGFAAPLRDRFTVLCGAGENGLLPPRGQPITTCPRRY